MNTIDRTGLFCSSYKLFWDKNSFAVAWMDRNRFNDDTIKLELDSGAP